VSEVSPGHRKFKIQRLLKKFFIGKESYNFMVLPIQALGYPKSETFFFASTFGSTTPLHHAEGLVNPKVHEKRLLILDTPEHVK
jgi:hypothetical protein